MDYFQSKRLKFLFGMIACFLLFYLAFIRLDSSSKSVILHSKGKNHNLDSEETFEAVSPQSTNEVTSSRKQYRLLINFAHNCCNYSQKLNCEKGLLHGFHQCLPYSMKNIDEKFQRENKAILEQKRGAGYWLWKPYLILEALARVEDNDIVMYTDSGSHFVQSAEPLFELVNSIPSGILLFIHCHPHKNYIWTKRDAFILMECETENCWNSTQYNGAFIVIRKTLESLYFMKAFLKYATDERILTDMPNTQGKPNFDGFNDHRHDQSILSLLAKKNRNRRISRPI